VRLSIVIPVLDEARHLEILLPELAQTCAAAEVVVADGGSTDGSVEIAARGPGTRVVASERGRARQMNAAAAVATGEVLLFLHADTRLPPGGAEAVRQAVADPSVAYGRFDVRFDSPQPAFRLIAALMNVRSRLTGICTGDQAIFVRRAAFERLGGYAEIALMEDVELTRRLRRVGRLAALGLRVTTSARRWQRDGVARTVVLMWALRFLYFCGVGPDRLHRWYYGTAGGAASRGRPGFRSGGASGRVDGPRAIGATGSPPPRDSSAGPPAPRAGRR
jgi:rSAM/selenodomain-associated transferase 2